MFVKVNIIRKLNFRSLKINLKQFKYWITRNN